MASDEAFQKHPHFSPTHDGCKERGSARGCPCIHDRNKKEEKVSGKCVPERCPASPAQGMWGYRYPQASVSLLDP